MADQFNILDRGPGRRRFAPGWFSTVDIPTGDSTLVTVAGTLVVGAFPVDVGATFDQVSIEVTATGVGSTFRAGIYADTGTGLPGNLFAELANLDTASATGVIVAAITLTLPPGMYWLGGAAQGGTPTVRARNVSNGAVQQATGGNVNATGYTKLAVTGALPTPFAATTGASQYQAAIPKVMLRCV